LIIWSGRLAVAPLGARADLRGFAILARRRACSPPAALCRPAGGLQARATWTFCVTFVLGLRA